MNEHESESESARQTPPLAPSAERAPARAAPDANETSDEASAAEAEPSAKPKRRRGHRGGRRHRRTPVGEEAVSAEETAAGDAVPEPTPADAGERAAGRSAAHTEAEAPVASPAKAPDAGAEGRREAQSTGKVNGGDQPPEASALPATAQPKSRRKPRRSAKPAMAATEAATPADEAVGEVTPAAKPKTSRRGRGRRRRPGRDEVVDRMGAEGAVQRGAQPEAEAPISPGTAAALEAEDALPQPAEPAQHARVVVAELPEHKEILVSAASDELRVALVEDGRLAEIYIERPEKRSYAGNIYRGKVDNVISGMDAAFVDIGLEKNGFLYVDEVVTEEGDNSRGRRIADVLKPAQELLVQVMKDPMGSKGARVTGQLSLAGRYLVYVPGGSGVGVSRRLAPAERDRLRELCKTLRVRNAGLIVRTAAEGKGVAEMQRDLRYLSRLWSRLKSRSTKIKAPCLLYEEADVSLQVARDLFNETFARVLVDDKKQLNKLLAYLEKTAPELVHRVELYEGDVPLFERHGIEEQILRALERKVTLPSGGNIVIDHAEALTVIDVNTGRYTGGKRLEDTITKTNLEAARAVVRQLRLRDIGGIIIIDFIDMSYARNREAVLAKLQAELETDRTKTYVVEISPLGLVEMTRQNITDGARGILTRECRCCGGKGRVLSEESMAREAARRVRAAARKASEAAFLYEVHHGVAERLAARGWLKQLESETGKRFFFEGSSTLPVDTLRLIVAGAVEEVMRQRLPVAEGEELEVELEHALTYSPADAVAHVDGYEIVVEGGRQYLGTKRRIRITTVYRTGASATLVGRKR